MTTSFSEPCAEWIFSFPLVLSSLTNTSTFQNTTQEQVRNCPDTIMVPISSGLFLLGYSTLIVASIVGLIWKRNSGHIRARTVSGMIFTIISSFLFVLGIQIRYVIGRAVYPCILYSIFFVVMPPCVAMPTILRLLRFYAQFQVSKMKSQQLTHLDQLSDQTMRGELSTTENNNSDLVSPRDNSMKNMNQRQQSTQISSPSMSVKCTSRTSNNFMQQYKLGFKERIWYRMNDLLSRHTYIMMFLIAILGVHVVLWFCITVIENSFFAEDRFFMTNDSMSLFGCGAQYFPSVLALFIYCGFFCIECLCAVLLLVRTDSDTWYIKKEALCLIPIQVLLGSLFLVTEFVEIFRILDHIVPSGTIMTTYTGIEIFVTIFLPICYAIYQDEKPKSEVYDTEMEMILNNKQAFESFLDHCRRSFCAEGLLFYKDLEKYKQCSSSTQRRDMALHIVQCYLVQGAPQELNIGNIETLREEILFVIHTNNHTVNKLPDHLFDRVKSVALSNLIDAYERLKRQNPNIKKLSNDWKEHQSYHTRNTLQPIPQSLTYEI
ncbi:hypothetical protein C9374_013739 [Naegleria lovaniensis]|uniref:RGS domain-containing protein n=1 Tax=Naegleria lovaniensis TaxID=51637 RepID=A0AA88GBK0_NAELO|nr:uncharacterized protein C9374_013739 [Naegleria lovaniensis]KAG2370904.1 hypothetical protein C9374_013739 [Naegleria lovaniensis]